MRKTKESNPRGSDIQNNVIQTLFAQAPELSFRGNKEVVIEGSKGVLEYSEEVIRINTSIGLLCFEGRGLNLKCISSTQLIIDGFITKLEFVI